MGEQRSKVTRRPLSKLERLVRRIAEGEPVPTRITPPLKETLAGEINAYPGLAAALEPEPHNADLTILELRALLDQAEHRDSDPFDPLEDDVVDVGALRRLLMALGMGAPRVDWVLLCAGLRASVAPGPEALRVAVRIGYPGKSYSALARSLDAEIPSSRPFDIAWQAHHALRMHGQRVCAPTSPRCNRCCIAGGCSFRGSGPDPASQLKPDE